MILSRTWPRLNNDTSLSPPGGKIPSLILHNDCQELEALSHAHLAFKHLVRVSFSVFSRNTSTPFWENTRTPFWANTRFPVMKWKKIPPFFSKQNLCRRQINTLKWCIYILHECTGKSVGVRGAIQARVVTNEAFCFGDLTASSARQFELTLWRIPQLLRNCSRFHVLRPAGT